MKNKTALFEIGTEEIPAKLVHTLSQQLAEYLAKELSAANLSHDPIHAFGTPRRLAVLIPNLQTQQDDKMIERRGPGLQAAFNAGGNLAPAALHFMKSCGVAEPDTQKIVEPFSILKTEKGEWLVFRGTQAGEKTENILPSLIEKAVQALHIPKKMRWGAGEDEFIRPVRWLTLLYGSTILPLKLFGKTASHSTYGHRFLHPAAIMLRSADDYEKSLTFYGSVIPDIQKRRDLIEHQLDVLAKKINGTVILDPELLDEVTGLVEDPNALLVPFDPVFLDVPAEALLAVMRDHQRTFGLRDATQKLMPYFITVSNIKNNDTRAIISGNERVMRARFRDAAFFYERDQQKPLADFLESAKTVVFQQQLGTLYQKAERIARLSHRIATALNIDTHLAQRAGFLAKADLMTDMVGEFPELQGIMGGYYATMSGEHADVATAIAEHYHPRHASDTIPQSIQGCCVAIADKIDTLVGIFGIGHAPTGDKDPFGLRRAALGLLKILLEKELSLDLQALFQEAQRLYTVELKTHVATESLDFVLERLRSLFPEVSTEIFNAVLVKRPTNPLDFKKRIIAIQHFLTLPEAHALTAANKRLNNILKSTKETTVGEINLVLLQEPAEKSLAFALEATKKAIAAQPKHDDYTHVLTLLAPLKAPVDTFFESVMVMVDDPALRRNRLVLLQHLQDLFSGVADIALLQK